jgi:hypothetical protein
MTRKVRSHSQHPAMVAISQPFVASHNKVICGLQIKKPIWGKLVMGSKSAHH